MSKLLNYNPQTNAEKTKKAMSARTQEFEEARDEIVDLVQKNKRDFDQRVSGFQKKRDMFFLMHDFEEAHNEILKLAKKNKKEINVWVVFKVQYSYYRLYTVNSKH